MLIFRQIRREKFRRIVRELANERLRCQLSNAQLIFDLVYELVVVQGHFFVSNAIARLITVYKHMQPLRQTLAHEKVNVKTQSELFVELSVNLFINLDKAFLAADLVL